MLLTFISGILALPLVAAFRCPSYIFAFGRPLRQLQPSIRNARNELPILGKLTCRETHCIRFRRDKKLYGGSLISPNDSWGLWGALTLSAAAGMRLEQKTKIGRALSGAVSAMLISTILTNTGILPSTGSVYVTSLQGFTVKLATPLLLLGADLIEIFQETGPLLKSFFLGTIGTLLGSFIAYSIFSPQLNMIVPGGDGWRVAGCITAKNIGGGFNFMAVADILKVAPTTISTGLAADNVMGLLYFPFISWLGGKYNDEKVASETDSDRCATVEAAPASISDDRGSIDSANSHVTNGSNTEINQMYDSNAEFNFLCALAVGLGLTAVSDAIDRWTGIPAIALSSLLSVFIASVFSKTIKPLVKPGEFMGKLLLLIFVSSVGNTGGKIFNAFADTSSGITALVGYGVILYVVHFMTVIGLGKAFKLETPDILLGSNANVGNAATASALAISMDWQSRLLPAILIGNFGSFIGTFGGLWLATSVLKPMYMRSIGL